MPFRGFLGAPASLSAGDNSACPIGAGKWPSDASGSAMTVCNHAGSREMSVVLIEESPTHQSASIRSRSPNPDEIECDWGYASRHSKFGLAKNPEFRSRYSDRPR